MRVRWWHWCLAVAVFLALSVVAFAAVIRLDGRRQWERHVAELRAQGRPTTVAELLAMAPEVDATVQAKWEAWMAAGKGDPPAIHGPAWQAFLAGGPPPAEVVAWSNSNAATRAAGVALLDDGVVFGYLTGRHRLGPPPYVQEDLNLLFSSSSLLSARDLANQLLVAAALADDPAPALRDLDRFCARLRRDTAMDLMVSVAVEAVRDRAWLEAASRDRVDAAAAACWLGDCPDVLGGLADAIRFERLFATAALTEALARGDRRGLAGSGQMAVFGWSEAHAISMALVALEDALRAGGTPARPSPKPWLLMARVSLHHWYALRASIIQRDAVQRSVRACAAIRLSAWRGVGAPPDAVARLLIPAPGAARLTAHLRSDRVVVLVDPTAPPAGIESGTIASWAAIPTGSPQVRTLPAGAELPLP